MEVGDKEEVITLILPRGVASSCDCGLNSGDLGEQENLDLKRFFRVRD